MTLSAEEQHRHSQNVNRAVIDHGSRHRFGGMVHSVIFCLARVLFHFIFMHVSVNDYKYSILHEYDESYEMSPKCHVSYLVKIKSLR